MTSKTKQFNQYGGWLVEPPCPKCGNLCVYNGNYYCTECDWAFPHPDKKPNSKKLQQWGVDAYKSLMEFRNETPDPEYLKLESWRY